MDVGRRPATTTWSATSTTASSAPTRQGRYEFTSIIPGCYEPRGASHLHVKVQGDSQPITTQLYIEGVPGNEDDDYYSSELLVRTTEDANGTKHGTFDFVIQQVTERKT